MQNITVSRAFLQIQNNVGSALAQQLQSHKFPGSHAFCRDFVCITHLLGPAAAAAWLPPHAAAAVVPWLAAATRVALGAAATNAAAAISLFFFPKSIVTGHNISSLTHYMVFYFFVQDHTARVEVDYLYTRDHVNSSEFRLHSMFYTHTYIQYLLSSILFSSVFQKVSVCSFVSLHFWK